MNSFDYSDSNAADVDIPSQKDSVDPGNICPFLEYCTTVFDLTRGDNALNSDSQATGQSCDKD
jgi:hypothetical protein